MEASMAALVIDWMPSSIVGRVDGVRVVRQVMLAATAMLALFALLAAVGCSASSALVGEWHVDGAGQKMITFANDGTFTSTCLGASAGGFKVGADGKAIAFTCQGKAQTLQYAVNGSTMTLSGKLSDGTPVQWALTRSASAVRPVK
jgi:hypothetical protein